MSRAFHQPGDFTPSTRGRSIEALASKTALKVSGGNDRRNLVANGRPADPGDRTGDDAGGVAISWTRNSRLVQNCLNVQQNFRDRVWRRESYRARPRSFCRHSLNVSSVSGLISFRTGSPVRRTHFRTDER